MRKIICGLKDLKILFCQKYLQVESSFQSSPFLLNFFPRPESFFVEMSQRFNKKLKVNAVDVDLFVNIVKDEAELDEMEHLLYNLRRTRRAIDTLESTHHAACRSYFKTSNHDRLLGIISKRVDFGLFPDHFCYNILLDHYIESENWKNAAKVAASYMLQENYSNKITNAFCIHAIHQYIKNPDREEWEVLPVATEEAPAEEEDEDDVEYIRVPVVRNEYFDDHFDLKDGLQLCGKTLHYIGSTFRDPLKSNLTLIGFVYHQKWSRAIELLNGQPFCQETIRIINDHVRNIEAVDENNENSKIVEEFKSKLSSATISKDDDLEAMISNELKEARSLEGEDQTEMQLLFQKWREERKTALKRSVDELMRDQRIKEIMEKRKELNEREKLLFFFENINKHEIELKEAEDKISELQSSAVIEDDYVPPKVR